MKTLHQSPTDDAFVQNPYPFYTRARTAGPLVFWADYDRTCATTHAAANHILRDKNWGREIPAELEKPIPDHIKPFMDIDAHSMLEKNPPDHTRLRAQTIRAFTSKRIAALTPEIETLCQALLQNLTGNTPDLIAQYCAPLPVTIIAKLLGVPVDMGPQLLAWSHDMVGMYQAGRTRKLEEAAAKAATEFADYLAGIITEKSARPCDDLISALIAATGDKLTPAELTSTVILLLNAGHEATVHALGNAIKLACETGTDPRIDTPGFVEEALRYDPPLHLFERHAITDCKALGQSFKRGDTIAVLLASANRCEATFQNADQFIPSRSQNPHLSFGAGIHFCVGAPLARLELQIALKTLFTELPNLTLTQSPRYAQTYHFHGLEKLEINP